jgi:hypothetical protein
MGMDTGGIPETTPKNSGVQPTIYPRQPKNSGAQPTIYPTTDFLKHLILSHSFEIKQINEYLFKVLFQNNVFIS